MTVPFAIFSRTSFHTGFLKGPQVGLCQKGPARILSESEPNPNRKHRGRIQIAADILEIAKKGSRKTRIMYLGNLSFAVLTKYLNLLVEMGLLEFVRERDHGIYATSGKGKRFLQEYHELEEHSQIVASKRRLLERHLTA